MKKKSKNNNNRNKFNLPKNRKSNSKLYKSANNEFGTNILADTNTAKSKVSCTNITKIYDTAAAAA